VFARFATHKEELLMVSPTTETTHLGTGRGMTGDVVAPEVHANIAIANPKDTVRWGPIFAGLFSALSTLVLLSVLGIAVAGSSYDPGDRLQTFGQAAGWWGAISALVAFFVGGLISARTAAVRGTGNGMFQGAMVWLVAIPLLMYLITSVVSGAARSAAAAASTAAQTAATAANTPQGQQAANEAQAKLPSTDQLQQQAQQTGQQIQQAAQNPMNQERAADATAKGAWGTLVSLLLGLGAAMVGGLVGARSLHRHHDHGDHHRHGTVTPAV
jgi:hypothetical protein